MPTLELDLNDFEALFGARLEADALSALLLKAKGEVKEFDRARNRLKIELADSNRPDLWSAEGIVRQLRPASSAYPFFTQKGSKQIVVSEEVGPVRPYLAACIARGMTVTGPILAQLIQSQEKLAEIFGQRRKTVSIGLYRLAEIAFPLRYELADVEQTRFVPLGFDRPMSLAEILTHHPKGIAYAHTLPQAARQPIFRDAAGRILSFPPIVNGREVGEVRVGDEALLVEATGCDLRMVLLALNIFACNLADRKGVIEPVEVVYPSATPFGKVVRSPFDFSEAVCVEIGAFGRQIGEAPSPDEAAEWLSRYGHTVAVEGTTLKVVPPPYRDDLMHPIDLIEDFAISRGYDTFVPEMPKTFTVGECDRMERMTDRLRELLIGLGGQEIVSNMLLSRQEALDKMNLADRQAGERPEVRVVEIENPMNDRFSLLRASLLPLLLRAEAASTQTAYPHFIFEVGEIARLSPCGRTTETTTAIAALLAHPTANFSEMQAKLEHLVACLGGVARLQPIAHPTFIEGRVGEVRLAEVGAAAGTDGKGIGVLGEVHPEVLSRWQIGMPTLLFEVEVDPLLAALSPA